jgi:hypothetical protein
MGPRAEREFGVAPVAFRHIKRVARMKRSGMRESRIALRSIGLRLLVDGLTGGLRCANPP